MSAQSVLDALRLRYADTTWSAYQRDVLGFGQWWKRGGRSLFSLTTPDIQVWISAHAGLAPSTMARRLSAVRQFYQEAQRQGYVQADPTQGIRLPQITGGKTAGISLEAAAALISASDRHSATMAVLVRLLLLYDVSAAEITTLTMDSINHAEGISIPGRRRSSDIEVTYKMRMLLELHRDYRRQQMETLANRWPEPDEPLFTTASGQPLTRWSIWRQVRSLGRSIGIEVARLKLASDARALDFYLNQKVPK